MSNALPSNPPQPAPGVVGPDEAKLRGEAAVLAQLENIRKRDREEMLSSVASLLEKATAPDRSSVPDFQAPKVPDRVQRITLAGPLDHLYARMDEPSRAWRNPESDHWMAEWIRGQVAGDVGRMQMASAKLAGMFPARADVLEGTADGAGGFASGSGATLIPRPLEAVVMIARDNISKLRRFASIYRMTVQEHNIPTAAAMTAYMVAEGATATQGEGTLAQVALVARKAQVVAIASIEQLNDAAINLVNVFGTRGGGALAGLEDSEFFELGTGSAPHVTKLTGTSQVEASTGTASHSDLVTMFYALPEPYLDNSVWFVARNVLALAAALKDGNGRPFYQSLNDPPLPIGSPIGRAPAPVGTLLGRPVYRAPLSTGDIWFGDPMAAYAIGDRQGITVESSPHVYFASDKIMWKITERVAGVPVDTVAGRYMTGITAVTSA